MLLAHSPASKCTLHGSALRRLTLTHQKTFLDWKYSHHRATIYTGKRSKLRTQATCPAAFEPSVRRIQVYVVPQIFR